MNKYYTTAGVILTAIIAICLLYIVFTDSKLSKDVQDYKRNLEQIKMLENRIEVLSGERNELLTTNKELYKNIATELEIVSLTGDVKQITGFQLLSQ